MLIHFTGLVDNAGLHVAELFVLIFDRPRIVYAHGLPDRRQCELSYVGTF